MVNSLNHHYNPYPIPCLPFAVNCFIIAALYSLRVLRISGGFKLAAYKW